MYEPGQEQRRPSSRLLDAGDLRLVGLIGLGIVVVLGGAAVLGLAVGLAVRIFLVVSGLR